MKNVACKEGRKKVRKERREGGRKEKEVKNVACKDGRKKGREERREGGRNERKK